VNGNVDRAKCNIGHVRCRWSKSSRARASVTVSPRRSRTHQGSDADAPTLGLPLGARHVGPTALATPRRARHPAAPRAASASAARALLPKVRHEGLLDGRHAGLAEGLQPRVRRFARRLGRLLSDAERGTLASRLDVVGPARLGDVVLDLDRAALAAWLASPTAT
jgi:hypothetical protein